MQNKLLIGRFIPGDSIIHKLDPRFKLVASFYMIILIFLAHHIWAYAGLFAFVLALVIVSKLKLQFFLKGVKPLIWLIVLTVGLQVLFSQGAHVYWQWGVFCISKEGLVNGGFIFVRFVLIIMLSTLLTLTTSPLSLADATESLLSPLERLHVPTHEIALMLSIALRFIPTLMDEADKIMRSQQARGVLFNEGSLIHRIKTMIPILIPLFISSFNRAEELADAMEARGYQGSEGRTNYRQLKWQPHDTAATLVLAVVTVLLLWMG